MFKIFIGSLYMKKEMVFFPEEISLKSYYILWEFKIIF